MVNRLVAEDYEEKGFVVLPKLLGDDEIKDILASFENVVDRLDDSFDHAPIMDRYSRIRDANPLVGGAIYDTMTTSLTLQKTLTSDKITQYVGYLLGVEITRLSHFFRCMRLDPPGENPNELNWHQDFQDADSPEIDSSEGVTVWIPLTQVGQDEGSIEVCVGSHRNRIIGVNVDPRGGGATSQKK